MVKPFSLLVKPASADCNLRCQYCFYIDKSLLYPETHIHRMPDDVLERMISTYRVSVRIFDSILNFLVDGIYTTCHLAGNCCQYFVVEYNGDIYPCDFFVTRQFKLGNVMEDSWEELQNSPTYVEFGKQKAEWNSECQRCRWLYLCSGDCLKHRLYGGGNSSKLSWLCAGWKKFFEHSMPYFKQLALKVLKERERAGIIAKTGRYELFPEKRLGRNDPCFCGSGKKYKKCHGNVDVSDAS